MSIHDLHAQCAQAGLDSSKCSNNSNSTLNPLIQFPHPIPPFNPATTPLPPHAPNSTHRPPLNTNSRSQSHIIPHRVPLIYADTCLPPNH